MRSHVPYVPSSYTTTGSWLVASKALSPSLTLPKSYMCIRLEKGSRPDCYILYELCTQQPTNFGAPGQSIPSGEGRQDGGEAGPPSSGPAGAGTGQESYQVVDSAHTTGQYPQGSNYDYQYSQQQQQQQQKSQNPQQQIIESSSAPSSHPPNPAPTATSSPASQHHTPPSSTNSSEFKPSSSGQPKRLHVSNVPFRFREPDLRQLFYVS